MSPSRLTGGYSSKWITLVNWEFNPDIHCSNQVISVFFYNSKEGPPQVFEAVPLYCPHYGEWRHMPPRDLECTPCRHSCGAKDSQAVVYPRQAKIAKLLRATFRPAYFDEIVHEFWRCWSGWPQESSRALLVGVRSYGCFLNSIQLAQAACLKRETFPDGTVHE
jgi:hypothetical protein